MRQQYREILEEAVAASASREDFDEMLLRATKRHLPVRYHSHFISMLGEILDRAEKREMTNRQAAREILSEMEGPADQHDPQRAQSPAPAPLTPARNVPAAETLPVPPGEEGKPAPGPPVPARKGEDADVPAGTPPPEECANAAEAPKILDLGGVRPDTLSPQMRDKLSKLVKAKKPKAEWEDASAGEVDPGLFFKGHQRCPPQVLPKKPAKPAAEKGEADGSAEPQDDSEEE